MLQRFSYFLSFFCLFVSVRLILEAINLLTNSVFERFGTLGKSYSRATQNLLFLNNVCAVVISFNCAQEFYNQMQFEM